MPIDPQSEIAQLAALLCEGELAPAQAARLEELVTTSAAARRFLVEYLQLHGELLWDRASGAGTEGQVRGWRVEALGRAGLGSSRGRWGWSARWVACLAATAVVLLVVTWVAGHRRRAEAPDRKAVPVAWLADVRWAQPTCGAAPVAVGSALAAGQQVELHTGLAEIHFASGARVILEGPARFDLVSRGHLFVYEGRLSVRVPAEAVGFAVATAGLVIVDRGTEFGVCVLPDGPVEVHVLAGHVDIQPGTGDGAPAPSGSWSKRLGAGQAVRVERVLLGVPPKFKEIALREDRFVRSMPAPHSGCVERLRRVVASEPGLMHHYPFEGDTLAGRLADGRGDLHLAEVVMAGGDGGGRLETGCRGFDPTTRAARPWRGLRGGNLQGTALQSETLLVPPREMTVELLLRLSEQVRLEEDAVCAAVSTGAPGGCAFLLAVLDGGRLAFRLEERSGWQFGRPDRGTLPGETAFRLVPGDWYYLAATFRAEKGHTVVSAFSANLTDGQRTLHAVLSGQAVPGVLAAGRLGIGKGFREDLTHAFAWPGELDEVAIYGRILDPATLQRHLDTLWGADSEP